MTRLALAFLVLSAGAAQAQVTSGFGLSQKDMAAPIEVSADRFDADLNSKTGTYTGNVLVKQGEMHLRADKVRVNVVSGKPEKIFANGNVVFQAPSGNASGDAGVYDVAPRLITLSGRVVLTKDKNVMRGSTLTVNLATGQAQLGAKSLPGQRVQGLFTPPPQQSPQQSPKTNP
ncbi:MAG TPA: lipopolysaccharide transport periplasmic protein LptA [Rhizomicrobium sp.]|nr:lipopolysaccharide transport periplasmic protein LptA [Rhizomicrobium sp.]